MKRRPPLLLLAACVVLNKVQLKPYILNTVRRYVSGRPLGLYH